jgi:hypothetical protein
MVPKMLKTRLTFKDAIESPTLSLDELLSRKLFENVNSQFANESEFVIIGIHLARQLDTGKVAWPSRSGSFQEVQPLVGTAVRRCRLRRYGRHCLQGSRQA